MRPVNARLTVVVFFGAVTSREDAKLTPGSKKKADSARIAKNARRILLNI
jgi:hypothetical protein